MKSRITIQPVVLSAQRRDDGSFNLKVRVTYKRKYRILPTQFTAHASDVTRTAPYKLKQNSAAWLRASELVMEIRRIVEQISYAALEYMDVDDVVKFINLSMTARVENFRLPFFAYFDKVAASKGPSAPSYEDGRQCFWEFIGKEIDISEISRQTIMAYQDSLLARFKPRTARKRLSIVKSVYNAAKLEFNDEDEGIIRIPRNPFKGLPPIPEPPQVRNAKDVKAIQALIDIEPKLTRREKFAADIYIMGFGLMGMNIADLYEGATIEGDIIRYNRRKTRNHRADRSLMVIKIDPRIRGLVDKFREGDHFVFPKMYGSFISMSAVVNAGLYLLAKDGLLDKSSYGSCRHSWATIASSSLCKIERSIVDECLVHKGDYRMADVYVERDWQRLWDANKTVLDLFDWPDRWV